MKLEILDQANPNCRVSHLGFCYPICVWHVGEARIAEQKLTKTFGKPARESHFRTVKDFKNPVHARWYVGQRQWRSRLTPVTDFWIVFRTERDRTLALMLLQG